MRRVFFILCIIAAVSCCPINKNCNNPPLDSEQISERCILYLADEKNREASDTLWRNICDYAILGHHYEGDAEYICESLHQIFYRNDTIGESLDAYLYNNRYSSALQDTIRVRLMHMILSHLYILQDTMPLNPVVRIELDSCCDYPYFYKHKSILSLDITDPRYFKYYGW
jgi:hypothetical protein